MGLLTQGRARVYQARQADGERLHRELQRQIPGRVPEQPLVHEYARRQADNRGVARGLQRRAASQFAWTADPLGFRQPKHLFR